MHHRDLRARTLAAARETSRLGFSATSEALVRLAYAFDSASHNPELPVRKGPHPDAGDGFAEPKLHRWPHEE
ncbi:MAG: hypothetical protein KDA73_19015 [Rhodobacteraceae bacterium]|nr:hypothetical protein [Paracoccaceae bacterium]